MIHLNHLQNKITTKKNQNLDKLYGSIRPDFDKPGLTDSCNWYQKNKTIMTFQEVIQSDNNQVGSLQESVIDWWTVNQHQAIESSKPDFGQTGISKSSYNRVLMIFLALITRRSEVQIFPPPPIKTKPSGAFLMPSFMYKEDVK